MGKRRKLFRVTFQEPTAKEPTAVTCQSFQPSDYFGLVTLEGFVFKDEAQFVVLPNEDETRKRFSKTERLHIPYHCLVTVEEFYEDEPEVEELPYIREIKGGPEEDESSGSPSEEGSGGPPDES